MPISSGPKPPTFDARFVGKGEEKVEVTNGEDAEKIRGALESADWTGPKCRSERAPAECDSSFYYQQTSAGFVPQTALQRKAHHDDRSTPV